MSGAIESDSSSKTSFARGRRPSKGSEADTPDEIDKIPKQLNFGHQKKLLRRQIENMLLRAAQAGKEEGRRIALQLRDSIMSSTGETPLTVVDQVNERALNI